MRAVIYTRLSLSTDESVSLERQEKAARDYARALGWPVAGAYADDGVSATKNRPEDRAGWSALLAAVRPDDVVIVWKIDRLARRLTDFMDTWRVLQERGAALASVEERLDLTTASGRAFAQILAVFGEMEAANTSARVAAARAYLERSGRWPGGRVMYGYRAVPNPDGAGWVLEQDPDRIGYVREMADRTLAGRSIYSTVAWLNEVGAPTARGGPWAYNTVDHIVRHPLLAGMTAVNPGNASHERGPGVLLDPSGLPHVDPALAVVTLAEWRALQARLAAPNSHRTPRAGRRHYSGVLSGMMWCGDPRHAAPVRMQRGTVGSSTGPRPAYTCPECYQTISNFEPLIIADWLAAVGDELRFRRVTVTRTGDDQMMEKVGLRLEEVTGRLAGAPDDEMPALLAELASLRALRQEAATAPRTETVTVGEGPVRTYREDWNAATTDDERQAIMRQGLDRIIVHRGKPGAWTDAAKRARLTWEWAPGFPPGPETREEMLKGLVIPED